LSTPLVYRADQQLSISDPATPLNPPIWPHLALALLIWKESVPVAEVLELASRLGQRQEIERDLTIAVHVFPELAGRAHPEKMAVPQWERKFAVPPAAPRPVLVHYEQ